MHFITLTTSTQQHVIDIQKRDDLRVHILNIHISIIRKIHIHIFPISLLQLNIAPLHREGHSFELFYLKVKFVNFAGGSIILYSLA